MGPVRSVTLLLAGLLAIAGIVPAQGAPVSAPTAAQGHAVILHPMTLVRLNDLDFGSLSVTTAGTATVNPNSGALTVTGGVTPFAGPTSPAHLQIAATQLALVIIHLPTGAATVTRVGGTETMTVSNWTLDGFAIRLIPANGILDVNIGGQLNVGANQMDGTYVGSFAVTADYF
jgi:hypothetical protein